MILGLDEIAQAGERCVEKVMMVEETTYDDQIVCHHSYSKKCHNTYVTSFEAVQVCMFVFSLLRHKPFRFMLTLRVFISFCLSHCNSQCESQKLKPHGNINYQSNLSHKCHDTNHVDVCCNMSKTFDNFKV